MRKLPIVFLILLLAATACNKDGSDQILINSDRDGNADELRQSADVLDEHGAAILSVYMGATGLDEGDLSDMMQAETWMRGEAAIENGFAGVLIDGVEEEGRAAAFAAWSGMVGNLNTGRELMSAQKPRKEIQAELAAVTEAKSAVDAELATAKATVEQSVIDAATIEARVRGSSRTRPSTPC